MATLDDINSTAQGVARQIGQLVLAFQGRMLSGSFTLAAGTTTVVAQASAKANSVVIPFATNTSAALIERTAGLYNSAISPGTSFSMSTQSGTAAGTETFNYLMLTPL